MGGAGRRAGVMSMMVCGRVICSAWRGGGAEKLDGGEGAGGVLVGHVRLGEALEVLEVAAGHRLAGSEGALQGVMAEIGQVQRKGGDGGGGMARRELAHGHSRADDLTEAVECAHVALLEADELRFVELAGKGDVQAVFQEVAEALG
jgi:hypothetical protein